MKKVGILYDNVSGNTGDIAIGLSLKKILQDMGVEFEELSPGCYNPSDYRSIIVGGGHILRSAPDTFYDKFRVKGPNILNAAGVYGSPPDLDYLNEYSYLSVRSNGDRQKLSYLESAVSVVPCTTMLLEDIPELPMEPLKDSIGIHVLPGIFGDQEDEFIKWVSELPYHVYLLPITFYNYDYVYLNKLGKRIKNATVVPTMSPLEIFTFIGKLDFFISASLHGSIFSYIHNRPFVLYNYDEKMQFFMEDRGLEHYLYDNFNGLKRATESMLKDKPDYSSNISRDKTALKKHLARIKEILPASNGSMGSCIDDVKHPYARFKDIDAIICHKDQQIAYQTQYAYNSIQLKDNHISNLDSIIRTLNDEISNRDSIIRTLNDEISNLRTINDKLKSENAQLANIVADRDNQLANMRQNIIWRMFTGYQKLVDKTLPASTRRRIIYNYAFACSRSLINYGPTNLLYKLKHDVIKKRANSAALIETHISAPISPLSLERSLAGTFTFPAEKLCEVQLYTATYCRTNADLIFSLMDSSQKELRRLRVPGSVIKNNDYTSFKFKPVRNSKCKTFSFSVISANVPSAAIWFNDEHSDDDLELFYEGKRLNGNINFKAFADLNIDIYRLWQLKNEPGTEKLERCKDKADEFHYRPKISIIMPVFNPETAHLTAAINSVFRQVYSNWELCIADASTKIDIKNVLNKQADTDSRIKLKFLNGNLGIAGNTNEALSLASGDYIALLDHDDELSPDALYEVVKLLQDHPEADMIYSDEDKIGLDGKRRDPFFKPEWSPDMFLSCMYTCHLGVYRKSLIESSGSFRNGFDGSQDYDIVLRLIEKTKNIFHIPKVLYHWRMTESSTASSGDRKRYAFEAGKRALEEYLLRNEIKGEVQYGPWNGSYRVKRITAKPLITIIIPTKDNAKVLKRCIDSIVLKTEYKNYEILIINNNSTEQLTFKYFNELQSAENIRVVDYNRPFNFSAINNFAVTESRGEYLLFLNNDTEVIAGEWMSAMLEQAQRPEIGAVGAKLLYPNNLVQHAGVILGLTGGGKVGVAGHSHKLLSADSYGYVGRVSIIHDLSAVTAACMMMRRAVFEEVGGFDENLTVAFNDVDICLRIRQKDYLIIYTPYALLYHHESLSRGYEDSPEKQERFKKEIDYTRERWGSIIDAGDPYYNPNLTLRYEDFRIKI